MWNPATRKIIISRDVIFKEEPLNKEVLLLLEGVLLVLRRVLPVYYSQKYKNNENKEVSSGETTDCWKWNGLKMKMAVRSIWITKSATFNCIYLKGPTRGPIAQPPLTQNPFVLPPSLTLLHVSRDIGAAEC
jgi:hypothetical protein